MTELHPVDDFCLIISGVICYKERVGTMYFSAFYKELYSEFKEKIEKFFKAFDFILKDTDFEKFIELIKSQYSSEFNVDLLVNDSIVEKICKENKELLETLLKKLSEFSDLKPEVIDSIKEYLNQFQDVKKLKETIASNKDELLGEDKSEEFLNGFYDDAEVKVKEIEKRTEDLDKEFESVCKFLSTTSEKFIMKNFIETLGKFNAELMAFSIPEVPILRALKKNNGSYGPNASVPNVPGTCSK